MIRWVEDALSNCNLTDEQIIQFIGTQDNPHPEAAKRAELMVILFREMTELWGEYLTYPYNKHFVPEGQPALPPWFICPQEVFGGATPLNFIIDKGTYGLEMVIMNVRYIKMNGLHCWIESAKQ